MHIRGVEMYNTDVFVSPRRLERMNGIQKVGPIHKNQQEFPMKYEGQKKEEKFEFKPVRVKKIDPTGVGIIGIQVKLMQRNDQMVFNTSINATSAYSSKEEVAGKNIDYMI